MELKELYDNLTGERIYLNQQERERFFTATKFQDNNIKYFCQMLFYSGCRLNEATGIQFNRIDFEEKGVILETLKRRQTGIFRFIDLPEDFLERLNDVYGISKKQADPSDSNSQIWNFTGRTGQNYVKRVMLEAGIDGKKACAKGLRHSFGVLAVENKIPMDQLREWMGHRFMDSTAIYTRAKGKERRELANRMWN